MSAILKEIIARVVPDLRAKGYKGSGQNYRRATDMAVSVVNFQKSSGGERFYVNVGVQLLFVPTEAESEADPKTIKEYECIFRRRLDPPENGLLGWPYSVNLSAVLVQRFEELNRNFVTPLMTIPGPLTEARVADFESNSVHPLLGLRNARNFLHYARILLVMDNRERAAEFASAAIEICPPRATSLLENLEKLWPKRTYCHNTR